MRLIVTSENPPPLPLDSYEKRRYAILSHTWSSDEIVFNDLRNGKNEDLVKRSKKIRGAQSQAQRDGFNLIWIDTVCIDKSSSAELGEAINSMFRWYSEAEVCYVYLSDVDYDLAISNGATPLEPGSASNEALYRILSKSRWFKRGWTLQELLASPNVRFFDRSWNFIGSLQDITAIVSRITSIHIDALINHKLAEFSIAQKMSWAAGRQTTRVEDRAYSLLGIFDVSLDIRYGEGQRAFIRLQEEIIAHSNDQSLFAWGQSVEYVERVRRTADLSDVLNERSEWQTRLLADTPDGFETSRTIVPYHKAYSTYSMINGDLRITAPIVPGNGMYEDLLLLNCRYLDDPTTAILLRLSPSFHFEEVLGLDARPKRLLSEGPLARIVLMDMTKVAIETTWKDLTIARGPDPTINLRATHLSQEYTRLQLPNRLWLVLEDSVSEGRSEFSIEHSDPGPAGNIWLEASMPQPENGTRTPIFPLYCSSRLHSPDLVVIRIKYRHGQSALMYVGIHGRQRAQFMLSGDLNEDLKAIQERLKTTWIQRKLSLQLPLRRKQEIGTNVVAIATLARENLGGENAFVVRVSIVPSSLTVNLKYATIESWRNWLELKTEREKLIVLLLLVFAGVVNHYLLSLLSLAVVWVPEIVQPMVTRVVEWLSYAAGVVVVLTAVATVLFAVFRLGDWLQTPIDNLKRG